MNILNTAHSALMCSRLCQLLLVWLLCSWAHAVETIEVIVYADESYPPYSYLENGELSGIYPAIFKRIFDQMPAYHVQIKPVPWKRGLMLLESGQGFALFPPYFRPLERPWMEYSEVVLTEQLSVFCTETTMNNRHRTLWPEDFYGLRIGINAGFLSGGEPFRQAARDGKLAIDPAPGNRSNLLKLLLGRIDCYVNDRLSILWEIERIKADGLYGEGNQKLIEAMTLSREPAYLGITGRDHGRYAFKADFVSQMNAVLQLMKKSGELQRMTENILSK